MSQQRRKRDFFVFSFHNEQGTDFVRLGAPQNLTLRLRSNARQSYQLTRRTGTVPRIRIDFRGAGGNVTLDAAQATAQGFAVSSWNDHVLELAMTWDERWFLSGETIEVALPGFSIDAKPGCALVNVTFENFGEGGDEQQRVPLFLLGAPEAGAANLSAAWGGANRVILRRRDFEQAVESSLRLRIQRGSGGGEVFVHFPGGNHSAGRRLATPVEQRSVTIDGDAGWSADALPSNAGQTWRLTPRAGSDDDLVTIEHIVSDMPIGEADVFVYHTGFEGANDTLTVLPVRIEAGSVTIREFKVNPDRVANINAPADVLLTWKVENATVVTLSAKGVVLHQQTDVPIAVEETTTFVLTAYDSALNQIVSESRTVTVDPPLSSRLVPKGTIALWRGGIAQQDLPPGWFLCDGSNNTPNLVDRFVMGAGGGAAVDANGEADTHTHPISELSATFPTSWVADHQHKMPSGWYMRKLSSGRYVGIDTRSPFHTDMQVQPAGGHSHHVEVKIPPFQSGVNNGGIRPRWYALAYIMKG